jgi:hypothetical protein
MANELAPGRAVSWFVKTFASVYNRLRLPERTRVDRVASEASFIGEISQRL